MAQQIQQRLTPYKFELRGVHCGVALMVSFLLFEGPMVPARALFLSLSVQQNANSSSVVTQDEKDVRALESGKPIEREMAGGGVHSYQIPLTANQYLHVVVDQRGIDVVVTLFDPEGKKLVEVNIDETRGPEPVSVMAVASGNYRLEVHSVEKEEAAGRYEVKITDLREVTAQDNSRVAAAQAYLEGQRLNTEGTAASRRRAVEKYDEARQLWRSVGDREGESDALHGMGYVSDLLGETHKAVEYYSQALTLRQAIGDRFREARTLSSIGATYNTLGEKQKALDHFSQALPLRRAVNDRSGEAVTLSNLGSVYTDLGETQKALDSLDKALSLEREMRDRQGEGFTLIYIGRLYISVGEKQKALDCFDQTLKLSRAISDRDLESIALNNIGFVYESLDEKQKALDYYSDTLKLKRIVGDRYGEGTTLNNIGFVYESLGDKQRALEYYNQALTIRREVGSRRGVAQTLRNIGSVYLTLGEEQKALDFSNQALTLMRAVKDLSGEAAVLRGIANVERKLGNAKQARAQMEAAIDIIQSLRAKVAGHDLRASYFAVVQQYFESYIDLLMWLHEIHPKEGHDAMAFNASESARARSLIEMLAEARVNVRQGVDPALLERERSLRQRLKARAERQMQLLSGKHTEEQAAALEKEIDAITTEYQVVESQIRARSPRYAELQPVPLTLSEIQTKVLDADTLLLEYSLGEERSYLWMVSRDSSASFTLPKRSEIEAVASSVLKLLTERGTPEEFETQAATLSQMLLGPVASRLGKKRLVIVADGVLQYVPFAALPVPAPPGRPHLSYVPLISDHEIVGLPSASVLATLRRQVAGRKPALKGVAVLADPVFSNDDTRVKARSGANTATTAKPQAEDERILDQEYERAAEAARQLGVTRAGVDFRRLTQSRREAEQIRALVPRTEAKVALDFDASLSTAMSREMRQYRIVHFATHGFLNPARPELSGLVLSLVNEKGEQQDGFLSVPEVFDMTLPAELVILSGCQTALGKQIRGEGLIGLTRGFMYAGAPRVMASLWSVQDNDTAELITRFYKAMLGNGLRPAAALRKAQISMWRDARWSAPHQWAGFVFQGEWR